MIYPALVGESAPWSVLSGSDGVAVASWGNKTTIGVLRKGKGRIVIFGALLPRPSEAREHWFGLDGYAISTAGQEMLLRALSRRK